MAHARIAVVGTGWWATQFHIPALARHEQAELDALVDPDEKRLAAASARFGPRRTFSDYRELVAAGEIDGVVIAVPHAFHYEIARAALDAGVHVLVEKPMVLKAHEAWDLVSRAREAQLHLIVGYTFQFTRHAALARQLVQSGAVGDIQLISGVFSSMVERYYRGQPDDYAEVFEFPVTGPRPDTYSDPKLSGGGHGQTQLTHALGMALWVAGLRCVEVAAMMASFDLPVDLVDAISYRFENGALGVIGGTGGLQPGQRQQQGLCYYGTDGFIRQDLINGRLSLQTNRGTNQTFPDLSEDEIYPTQAPVRSLVDLILGDGDNRAPGEPAAMAVELLEAAYRAAAAGRTVTIADLAR